MISTVHRLAELARRQRRRLRDTGQAAKTLQEQSAQVARDTAIAVCSGFLSAIQKHTLLKGPHCLESDELYSTALHSAAHHCRVSLRSMRAASVHRRAASCTARLAGLRSLNCCSLSMSFSSSHRHCSRPPSSLRHCALCTDTRQQQQEREATALGQQKKGGGGHGLRQAQACVVAMDREVWDHEAASSDETRSQARTDSIRGYAWEEPRSRLLKKPPSNVTATS